MSHAQLLHLFEQINYLRHIDGAVSYATRQAIEYSHSTVILSENQAFLSDVLNRVKETLMQLEGYAEKTFYLEYSPHIDSEKKLTKKLQEAFKMEKDNDVNDDITLLFDDVTEEYPSPILIAKDLDKILFYGGETHKKLDFDKYLKTLEKVKGGGMDKDSLEQFHHVGRSMPNLAIRAHSQSKKLIVIGSATKGTPEYDHVFRNRESPLWCNYAEFHS